MSGALLISLLMPLLLLVLPGAAWGVSPEFFGLNADDAFWLDDDGHTYAAIMGSGVRTLRQGFVRGLIEPSPGQYDFRQYDRYVAQATSRGLRILPVLVQDYASRVEPADFAGFGAAVTRRYGMGGSFWAEHPELPARPLRQWQVWNEPNHPSFWAGRPNPDAYARVLRSSAAAIRAVDPGARILTAGIATRTRRPWQGYLSRALRKAPRAADAVAIHPYAETPHGVLEKMHQAATLTRSPLVVTELGWATGGAPSSMVVGLREQALRLRRTLRLLVAERRALRLRGVDMYNWRDLGAGSHWGNWTGLLSNDGQPKPSYWTVRSIVDDATED